MRVVLKIKNIDEFNKRFENTGNGYRDRITKKLYYCPRDIGFDFNIKDCLESKCSECWKEAKEYLVLRKQ